jgi:hypothetical protein
MQGDFLSCGKNEFSPEGPSSEVSGGSGVRARHWKSSSINIAMSKRDLKDTP